jgi:hypothetical protein
MTSLAIAVLGFTQSLAAAPTKARVSPYARAAAAHARAGRPPGSHSPTLVQGMGKPRKSHAMGGK